MAFDKLHIICECESPEHQLIFIHDNEDDLLYLETHLINYNGFFKRLWIGIKYAFGYKCKYGNFDTVLISPRDRQLLLNYLRKVKNPQIVKSDVMGYDGC